ncbi:hypothetical protein C4D27_13045 [Clostridium perfringens]
MGKVVIQKNNSRFSYPYFIKKGVLGFYLSEIGEDVFLENKDIYVDFKSKSIIIETYEKRFKYNLNDKEIDILNKVKTEEHNKLANLYKNMLSGEEEIFVFPCEKEAIVLPGTYLTGDIQSRGMVEATFLLMVSKQLGMSNQISYRKFEKILSKLIFSKFNYDKYIKNYNKEECYFKITFKDLINELKK